MRRMNVLRFVEETVSLVTSISIFVTHTPKLLVLSRANVLSAEMLAIIDCSFAGTGMIMLY
jgi:hypothetical protein